MKTTEGEKLWKTKIKQRVRGINRKLNKYNRY
jgi:hypothetical protein